MRRDSRSAYWAGGLFGSYRSVGAAYDMKPSPVARRRAMANLQPARPGGWHGVPVAGSSQRSPATSCWPRNAHLRQMVLGRTSQLADADR
jgi:hypothetical protein